jgi:hypothetical protein
VEVLRVSKVSKQEIKPGMRMCDRPLKLKRRWRIVRGTCKGGAIISLMIATVLLSGVAHLLMLGALDDSGRTCLTVGLAYLLIAVIYGLLMPYWITDSFEE